VVSKGKRIEKKDLEFKIEPPPTKCPRCGGEMIEGLIGSDQGYSMDEFRAPWVKKYPGDPHDPMYVAPVYPVTAHACKKCGYTELHTNFGKVKF